MQLLKETHDLGGKQPTKLLKDSVDVKNTRLETKKP